MTGHRPTSEWHDSFRNAYRDYFISHERKAFSQSGEDGLLEFIFSEVGMAYRTVVEIGCGDGYECNAANLILNGEWSALMVDADPGAVARANAYYARSQVSPNRLAIVECRVSVSNVNALIHSAGYSGEVDLLSIDIDGNDYWIWKAIDIIQPRVVVIEYNASFGPDRSLTIPYSEDFRRSLGVNMDPVSYFHGASLTALHHLGRSKGYGLVGCNFAGINAFFVRDGLSLGGLRFVPPEEVYFPIVTRAGSWEDQFEAIRHMPLVSIA